MLEKTVKQKPSFPIQNQPIVEVDMPSVMRIELVQGNELRHYEIFFSLTSICLSTATGFWTSFVSMNERNNAFFLSATAFSLLALISIGLAVYYRKRIYAGKINKSFPLSEFR